MPLVSYCVGVAYPLAFFPGYATPKESLLGAASAFHGWGYTAVLVDFRGVGGSSRSDTTLGVREASRQPLAQT